MLHVTNFTLTVDGLTLTYTFNGQTTTAKYDPSATCSLLKGAGFIEDFTTDNNGEPVILFSDNNHPVGYGFELWCHFVKSFFLNDRVAQMLAEWKERCKNVARFNGRINYLLYPLKATA
jgi:hypothetical protein